VHERVHPTLGERKAPHGLDQRLTDRPVTAVQPDDLHVGVDLLLLLRPRDLHEGMHPRTVGHGLQRGGDRGQRALVTGQQMPVRPGVGGVRPAGAEEPDGLAGLDAGRPRPGETLVAVDHEVECQLTQFRVPGAHRVRTRHGPLVARELLADPGHVEGLRIGHTLGPEQQLDVVVGARARGEIGEAVAAEDHTLHMRRESLRADHARGVGLGGPPCRTLCHDSLPKFA
jgi:hypothetical protein